MASDVDLRIAQKMLEQQGTINELRARVEELEVRLFDGGREHDAETCSLGPLCPWCEIQRLATTWHNADGTTTKMEPDELVEKRGAAAFELDALRKLLAIAACPQGGPDCPGWHAVTVTGYGHACDGDEGRCAVECPVPVPEEGQEECQWCAERHAFLDRNDTGSDSDAS